MSKLIVAKQRVTGFSQLFNSLFNANILNLFIYKAETYKTTWVIYNVNGFVLIIIYTSKQIQLPKTTNTHCWIKCL